MVIKVLDVLGAKVLVLLNNIGIYYRKRILRNGTKKNVRVYREIPIYVFSGFVHISLVNLS